MIPVELDKLLAGVDPDYDRMLETRGEVPVTGSRDARARSDLQRYR